MLLFLNDRSQNTKNIDFGINHYCETNSGSIKCLNQNLGLLLFFENLLTKVENQKKNILFLYYTNQNL